MNNYRCLFLLIASVLVPGTAAIAKTTLKDSVLTIGSDVREITAYKYADNHEIKIVDASGATQLKEIGEYAFLGCENLKSIKFPYGLSRIGEGAFRECGLIRVLLPESLRAIPRYAFAGCQSLESVKFPSNLEDIGSHSFIYCGSLKELCIPESVNHIGSNVFSRCASLKEVTLPKNIKELESYAFSDCVSLKKVSLPENSNMLGELIFSGCISLKRIEEFSTVPPVFDCDSYLFEPEDEEAYVRCHLVVKRGCKKVYSDSNGWKLFRHIDE